MPSRNLSPSERVAHLKRQRQCSVKCAGAVGEAQCMPKQGVASPAWGGSGKALWEMTLSPKFTRGSGKSIPDK